jgi:hypothetical protein
MKYPRNIKKDLNRFIDTEKVFGFKSIDLRKKDYRDFVQNHGGEEGVIREFYSKLAKIPEYIQLRVKRNKQTEIQKKRKEQNKEYRYVGNVEVTYHVTEEREKMDKKTKKTVKYYPEYERVENIRFDKVIAKKDIDNEVKQIIENARIQTLSSDKYLIKVGTPTINTHIQQASSGTKLESIRMRDAGAFMIDGYENQEWDTKTNKCVFDYIIATYGNIKGFKNTCNYEELNKIFRWNEEEDCINDGVNTLSIEKFCMRYKLPMYALDDDNKAFKVYNPESRNKNAPAMMFKVSNKHFYPVPDDLKKSILKTTSILNSSSDLMVVHSSDKKIPKESLNVIVLENTDAMMELGKFLNKNKAIPKQITMSDKKITSFSSKENQYTINQQIGLTKILSENMGIKYEGQTLGVLINKIIENTIKVLPKSSHNPNVLQNLLIAKKNRSHGGLIDENTINLLKDPNTIARDITKCYTSIMYKPIEEWIKLDFNDTFEIYEKSDYVKLGLYRVETEDTTLFKKSDIYSSAIVKKALKEGIQFKITHQLLSRHKEEKSLFVKVIDTIVKYSKGDNNIYKLLINMLSGLLGRTKSSRSDCRINSDIEQIFHFIHTYEAIGKQTFINKIPDTHYFLYGIDNEVLLSETNLPMYIQILDQSNIKLYDMV